MPKSGISNELENPEQMARSELDRDGLLIDEQDILDAMYSGDDESAKHYLPKGKGNSKRINRDDFAKLLDNLKTVLSNICKDMGNGIADAEPLMDSNHNACEYCEMKALCRKDSYNKKPSDNGDGE